MEALVQLLLPLLKGALWLGLSLAVAVYLYGLNLINRWKHRHLPGPKPRWFVGNAARVNHPDTLGPVGKSHEALQRWAQQYGPAYVFYMGRQPMVVLTDPELIREAGVRSFKLFHDRPIPRINAGPPDDTVFVRRGMVIARGKYWSGMRAACEPLFHRSALESYAPPMNNAVGRMIERLRAAAYSREAVNMTNMLNAMTMDVIGSTVFGVDFRAQVGGGEENAVLAASQKFFKPFGGISPLFAALFFGLPQFGEVLGWVALKLKSARLLEICIARALLRGASQQLLDNARAVEEKGRKGSGAARALNGSSSPLGEQQQGKEGEGCEQLLEGAGEGDAGPYSGPPGSVEAAQAEAFKEGRRQYRQLVPPEFSVINMLRRAVNKETGGALSDAEIQSQLVTFLLAGYETTSLSLGYTLYEVAQRPDVQDRIRAEVHAALKARPGMAGAAAAAGALGYGQLEALPFTEACFSEGMRLYPPVSALVALAREAGQEASLGGFRVPAGSHVTFNVWALHRDPALYPEPDTFRPERFLPDSAEAKVRHPYAYIPFGLGPRKCLGYKFAMEEGVLALQRLVCAFDIALDPTHHPTGRPLELTTGLTMNPTGGIWVQLRPRMGS